VIVSSVVLRGRGRGLSHVDERRDSRAGHAVVMADIPVPEVAPRAQARMFAPFYKARILAEFEALPKAERAGSLRREGLYATLIRTWQAQAA